MITGDLTHYAGQDLTLLTPPDPSYSNVVFVNAGVSRGSAEYTINTLTLAPTNYVSAVPEPSAIVLMGIGSAVLFIARRLRRGKA